ncbi:MAG: vitamin K epoxide reductase family protein [Planctomycetaceae bacterium]
MITTQELPNGRSTGAGPDLRIWDGQSAASISEPPAFNQPSQSIIWTLRLLCLTALGVSGYLAYAGLTGNKIAGCGGELWDCNHVTSTRWGKWFGLPVGLAACGMYAACTGSLCFTGSQNQRLRRGVWNVMTVAGIAAGLAAVWFISLQILVIGHLCKWCLVAHGCGLAVAGIILWNRPAARLTTRLSILSILGVGVLVAGQLIHEEATFVVEEFPDPSQAAPAMVPANESDEDEGFFAPPGMMGDDEDGAFEAPAPPPEFEPPEFAPPPIGDE